MVLHRPVEIAPAIGEVVYEPTLLEMSVYLTSRT